MQRSEHDSEKMNVDIETLRKSPDFLQFVTKCMCAPTVRAQIHDLPFAITQFLRVKGYVEDHNYINQTFREHVLRAEMKALYEDLDRVERPIHRAPSFAANLSSLASSPPRADRLSRSDRGVPTTAPCFQQVVSFFPIPRVPLTPIPSSPPISRVRANSIANAKPAAATIQSRFSRETRASSIDQTPPRAPHITPTNSTNDTRSPRSELSTSGSSILSSSGSGINSVLSRITLDSSGSSLATLHQSASVPIFRGSITHTPPKVGSDGRSSESSPRSNASPKHFLRDSPEGAEPKRSRSVSEENAVTITDDQKKQIEILAHENLFLYLKFKKACFGESQVFELQERRILNVMQLLRENGIPAGVKAYIQNTRYMCEKTTDDTQARNSFKS